MAGKRRKFQIEVDEKGCFNVTSHYVSDPKGTIVTSKHGKRMSIARFIYEECFGEVDEGLVIRHKCDNTNCINPEHLETGTHYDNVQDAVKRGRTTRGEKNPGSKLTVEEVKEIRRLQHVIPIDRVASMFGISQTQVWRVWTRENWKYVNDKEDLLCMAK